MNACYYRATETQAKAEQMADPSISEIKYLGNGDQDMLEVRVPDDYPDPENLRLVIYDRNHNGSTTASPAASDIYEVVADGQLYTEDADTDGEDDDGILHYTFGTSENGTTIFLHANDAVGLYNVATGETYGFYSWSAAPYTASTNTGDPFAGLTAEQLDPTGQIRDQTSLELQPNGDYTLATDPEPGSSFICFAKGTRILTVNGLRRVETLCIGDQVITKDHGAQTIRWIGNRHFEALGPTDQTLQPIMIKAHAFGPNTPMHDTKLSPNHTVLNDHWKANLYFGDREVLAAVKSLLETNYADQCHDPSVTYFHILLDQHSLIKANGMWAESLFLGSQCMEMLSPGSRSEIFDLFPQLHGDISGYGQRARHQIRSKEAELLR